MNQGFWMRLQTAVTANVLPCLVALGVLLASVLAPLAAHADEIRVRAEVDRTHATLDEQIQLQVIIEGRLRSVEEPERPPFDDFDLYSNGRSQNMQIVNGDVSASNIFSYVLVPKREGKFTIGAFTVHAGGKDLKTEPIAITVGGGPGVRGAPAPESGEPETREDRDIFVLSRVDKQNAYVNEQILYTFYLYRAERAAQITNLNYSQPSFQGFWVEKLKDGEKQSYKMLNGRRYIVQEVPIALFPTTSGKLTIDPASLQVVMLSSPFGFSLFDRGVEKVLRTKPVEVNVSMLPVAGKPAIFEGAVGEGLELSAKQDRTEVAEGDPVTITARIEGVGNVKTFSKPRLGALPQFKVYDADSKTDVQSVDRVAGSRTWEIVLVPKDEGEHDLGPMRLAYFDTREARYRVLETKPLHVSVVKSTGSGSTLAGGVPLPAQQDIQILGSDIEHIRTDVALSDDWTPLYRRGLFGALAPLPLLAVCGMSMVQRRRKRFASDVALARSSRARKLAAKTLAAARRALDANQGEVFYTEVQRALRQYVGDKLNVSATGMTHGELREKLQQSGVTEESTAAVLATLERCDAARFAPGSMGHERLQEVLQATEALLVALEGQWGKKAKLAAGAIGVSGVLGGFGLLVGGVLIAAAAAGALALNAGAVQAQDRVTTAPVDFVPPEQLLLRGHQAYESSRFADAVEAYRKAERAGVRNGALYYDLGNAYFKSGNLAQAIANYRRAEALSPRDPHVRANLDFVLAHREDKALQPRTMVLFAWAQLLFNWLSLNEWVAATTLLYALACVLWVVRTQFRLRARALKWVQQATVGLSVLALAFTLTKVNAVRGVERGVIAESRVAVMSGPGTDYTAEFSLHEGAEVRVEARRADWVRIAATDKLQGWIPAKSLITM